jgi:hypothetical protein
MKKIILLIIAFTFCLKMSAQNKIIKANPLGLAFGVANLGVEFSGKNNQSTTISVLYYSKSNTEGFGIGLEQRFYFNSNELKGFHAGPSVGYLKLSDNYNDDFDVFSVGAEIGHQWFLNKNFTIDLFSGVGFLTDNIGLNLSFGLGLSLGYAW